MEMRTNCEKCNEQLEFDSEAYICSYECTYCKSCAEEVDNICPNCDGELVRRPKRATKDNIN